MADNRPIGIFDSGVGGLTVAKAIYQTLPNESLIYYGDTKHLPYGDKSQEAIKYYSLKICKHLLKQDVKMIVVACNTASTATYPDLIDFFGEDIAFVNVVDPLVNAVANQDYSNIGIIATKATVSTNVYADKLSKVFDGNIVQKATPLLAPMIEQGFCSGKVSNTVIEEYLSDTNLADIDALLLACTHYPLIRDAIDQFYGGKVDIYDSTTVVANQVKQILSQQKAFNTSGNATRHFYISDHTTSFEETANIFFDENIELSELDIW